MGSAGLESRYCQSCVPPGDSGRKSSSFYHLLEATIGLPRWLSGKEPGSQCRRHGCDPWIRKIPWRRKWQPTPVFLAWRIPWTEEPGRLQSMGSPRVGLTRGGRGRERWTARPQEPSVAPLQAGSGSPHLVLMPLMGRTASPPSFQLSSPPCPLQPHPQATAPQMAPIKGLCFVSIFPK